MYIRVAVGRTHVGQPCCCRKHGLRCSIREMTIEMVKNPDTTLPFVSDNYLYDDGVGFSGKA